ncbi:MAG: FG-GAP repeat protein, partial [Fimbriimonadaceae bacterium]|nr:FG-GAP repeat protein [Chitinophagales bacterium]
MKVDLKHKLPIFLTVLLLTGTLFFTNKYFSVEEKTISANNPLPGNEKPETVIKGNVQQSWLSEIQSSIEAAQYKFTSIGKNNFVTFNKAHALSTEVTPGSMEVSGMDANNDKWNAALMLHSVNSNLGNMHTGDLISTDVEANKLIYNYNNLSIEYINTTDGIRQNFIVKSAPEQAENVSVILNIESKLNPHLKSNTLILSKNNSQLYKYSDLKVWDKNGKPLQANMSLNGNQLALNVDVRNAEFPVTIDPLSTTYAWKHTGGQSHAGFGFWVSGNGDVNGDGFSDIAIGAPEYTNTHSGEGAVFVFHGSPSGLLTTPSFVSYGGQDSSGYGRCVSIEGDVDGDGFDDLIIGAHEYDNPQKNEGRVWLHRGSISGVEPIADWNFETNRKGAKGLFSRHKILTICNTAI